MTSVTTPSLKLTINSYGSPPPLRAIGTAYSSRGFGLILPEGGITFILDTAPSTDTQKTDMLVPS